MKLIIVAIAFLMTACASNHFASNKDELKYETIRQFVVGDTTKDAVVKALGTPASQSTEKDKVTFRYNDRQTGFQRLTITFLSDNDRLTSLLWVPKNGAPESSLKEAKTGFRQASFKEVTEEHGNPHDISLAGVQYIDKASGVTIRYNQEEGIVEAIAIYGKERRVPAKSGEPGEKKVNYTFGDEAVSQK